MRHEATPKTKTADIAAGIVTTPTSDNPKSASEVWILGEKASHV
jgi:hypothetical protein